MASSNPFDGLTEPSTAFAPQNPGTAPAPSNPFEGLAAYSTAPDKAPRGTEVPNSVAGTEPLRWITINGHPIPIKAPSGADHMLPVPGNTNVLQDPVSKEHYFKTPGPDGKFQSIWDTQRKVSKDGKIISHVKGVGDHEWGDDPKVAEKAQKTQDAADKKAQKTQDAADKKEQKDVTADAVADTKDVLQQAAIPVTVAKETLAHQDKLYTAQVAKAQTNKKLSDGVKKSTQDEATAAHEELETFLETTHTAGEGSKYQGLDADGVPKYKKQKLPEGMAPDQYTQKETELRTQYRDLQTKATAAAKVDEENKRFVATAYFHKQAWEDQSKPLREGLKQTQTGLKIFKDQKLLTEGRASMAATSAQQATDFQANNPPVRTDWPLKTNTGRNADNSARPPQITPPPDFNQYNADAPQPSPAQKQAAGRDVIAEHVDISGLPPMPRVEVGNNRFGMSFLPLNGSKPATPVRDGEVPDLTKGPDDTAAEARASVLRGLQNTNRGMAYNVPDKPIAWEGDTLKHENQPVGKIQKDDFGAPTLYIDYGQDGQKVSPSLNSGHYYDGIPEMSSPSPAHLDEFKAQGVTKPEDVQKAWGQRHWSTADINELVDQWGSSNDDERQDLIAQTNPSQANISKGQRRLNSRELFKDGMISAQDARMLDHAFYGRKPGVDDPEQSFEQFKNSDHPDAKALASFAHDNTTLNPIAAGASQDAYGRALTSWSTDYFKRNSTSPDFDHKAFIATRDKLLQPLGQRASAWLDKTGQGLFGMVPGLTNELVNFPLGIAKTGSEMALEKVGVTPAMAQQFLDPNNIVLDTAAKVGIHPHDAQERELVRQGNQGFGNSFASVMGDHFNYDTLKAAVSNLFSPINPSEANAATAFEGKNGAKINAATKELFDAIDSESMTPAKLKELSTKLRDASIEIKGIKNFDATNKVGYDYNGRYDASDPRSPLAQALAGYAETADPTYKEMFKHVLSTSEGGDALAQKMSEYLQAHGHIAGTPVGAAMSWLNRLSGGALHYDNPDAWKTLSESAGNTVQPLQILAIQAALGATSALPNLFKGAASPIVKSTGRALLASGELANDASGLAKTLGKVSTIPLADAVPASAGSTFVKQLGTSALHGAGFMALQQPGMGTGQSLGDIFQAGAEGAAIGAVAGGFNAAARALDIRRTNAAQNKAHEDFVANWNKDFPHNPITVADSKQASHYMGPEEAPRLRQIRTLSDQFSAIKDKVAARTATREEYEQLKPLRLQLDNLFVAQQHTMDGAVSAMQEINGIADPNLKGWANAALKQLSGNPLTSAEETLLNTVMNEDTEAHLSYSNAGGTHTITDAGLATMEQVAPATRRAYFPSDETSQFTTPNEQPAPAQPNTTETTPAPSDPGQEVPENPQGTSDSPGGTPIGETDRQSLAEGGHSIRQSPDKTGEPAQMGGRVVERDPSIESEIRQVETPRQDFPPNTPSGDIADFIRKTHPGVTDAELSQHPEYRAAVDREKGWTPEQKAPSKKVNPDQSSPEPAPQADSEPTQKDIQPVAPKDAQAEGEQHMQATGSAPSPKHVRNFLAKAAIAFGHSVVDFGVLPKAMEKNLGMQTAGRALEKVLPTFKDHYGKVHNWGTQWIDQTFPGSNLGQWMDGLKKVNPEVYDFLHHKAHTDITMHRMWFGHDPLANFAEVVQKHGFSALPDFALQLFKDSLTKSGIPHPGMQWLWESKLMDGHRTHEAADWMSLNFGEAAAKGVAIASTFKLYRDLGKGKQIHDGWAAVGFLVKVVAGYTYQDPVLILTGLADIPPIIASLSHKGIKGAFKTFDGLMKQAKAKQDVAPAEKKLQGFKPQTTTEYADPNTPLDRNQNLSRGMVQDNTEGVTERSGAGIPSRQTPTRSGEGTPKLDVREQVDSKPDDQTSATTQPTGISDPTSAGKARDVEELQTQSIAAVDYQGIARQQIEDQLKDSPALRELVQMHNDVPTDMKDAGGMALTREGSIRVSLPQLEEQLQGMTPEEAKTHVSKVLDEEVRHVAHIKAARSLYDQKLASGETGGLTFPQWQYQHYGRMWHEFSPEQQKAVHDAYGKTLDNQPDANKAMEALRIISQRRATGDQSETSMLWQKLPQAVLEHLKAVFDYLKNLSKQKLTPALEQELSGIEQVLKEHNYGQKAEELAEPIDTSNAAEHAAALERAADHIEGIGGKHHVGTLRAHAEELRAHVEEEANNHPAMVELRKSNDELPAAAQKLWTPEVYAKAADFYKTGEVKALDGLTVIQKRRITSAGVKSSPEALAKEAAAEKAMRAKEADDLKHMRATTEPDLQAASIKRTPEEIAQMEKELEEKKPKPNHEERAEKTVDAGGTSSKNAVAEEQRKRLDWPDTQKLKAMGQEDFARLGEQRLARDPQAAIKVMDKFDSEHHVLSGPENYVVTKALSALYHRAEQIDTELSNPELTKEERSELAYEAREMHPLMDRLWQVASHTGTLWHEAGMARQAELFSGESLESVERLMRNAGGKRDLTGAEHDEAKELFQKIDKAKKKVDAAAIESTALKVSEALQRAVTEASRPITAPTQHTISGTALKQIKSRAAKARELLAKSTVEPAQSAPLKSAPLKLSPEKLAAYADIAAEHLLEGRNVSDELVKEYPDSRAHLSEIITEAQKVHASILAEAAKVEQAKAAKAAAKLDPKNIMAAARAGEYGDEISPQWMHELAMAHIVDAHKDGGTPTETDIIKRMVKDVKTIIPEAGEREVREALVDYGKISQPNPEQMATELRQLKRISRLVLSKEDASEGTAPPKSQIRDKQSPEERQMRRELARLMDEHNVERQDPERALASRRDRLKSSLNNQIEDLQRIIDAKAKPERKLSPVVDDIEIRQLKARKQALVDQVNAMDSVRTATEAQRVETAIKAAKASQMEWERRLKEQEVLDKKTKTPESNAQVVEARKQRNAAKEAYHDMMDARDMHLPGALFKEAERKLDAAKKREAEIRDKIINGDTSTPEGKPSFTTPELEAQKKVNAELNKELAKMRSEVAKAQRVADKAKQANLPGDLFKRAETTLKAALKREADLQDKITKGDLKVKQITGQFKTPELEQAQARVKALNEQMVKLRREAPRTAEQESKAREVYLRQLAKREAQVRADMAAAQAGTYTKPVRTIFPHNDTTLKALAELGKAKQELGITLKRIELANRTLPQKGMDLAVKARRALLLSGGVVLGKLATAAGVRLGLTPVEEAIGGFLGLVPGIRSISKQAPREGGFNPLTEIRSTMGGLSRAIKDTWGTETENKSVLRTGKSDIDLAYGKNKSYDLDKSWLDWFGNLHATLKGPAKQTEFLRAYEKRLRFAQRKGEDITKPEVKLRIGQEAYVDANRSIFMQDNAFTNMWNTALTAAEHSKKFPNAGKVLGTAARIMLPIVKVPTNIVGETVTMGAGIPIALGYMARELVKHGTFKDMDPMVADTIMRNLKKGSIGAALLAYGMANPQQFGGYYHKGEKREPDAVHAHHVKMGDWDVPGWATHAPAFEVLHFGADIRRVADSLDSDGQPRGKGTGLGYAASGLINSVPFVSAMGDVSGLFQTGYESDSKRGRFLSGLVVPQGLKEIAQYRDKDEEGHPVERQQKSISDYIKAGVPGLRETLPMRGAFSGLGPPPTSNAGSPPVPRPHSVRRPHAPTRRH